MSIPSEQLEGLSSQDLIAALQGGGGVVSEFLGIEGAPADFKARRPKKPRQDPTGEQFGFVNVKPRFTTEHVGAFYALSPEERIRLQTDLSRAGVLKSFVPGDADPDTLTAYEAVLGFANRNGYTRVRDAIDALSRAKDRAEALGVGGVDAPSLPAPENVRQGVKQALIQQMGSAPDDVVEQMMAGYNSVYSSRLQGSIQPPTIDAFVESKLENNTEAQVFQGTQTLDTFYDALDSGLPEPPLTRSSF